MIIAIFAISPVYAETECVNNPSNNGCISYEGCYFEGGMINECTQCNNTGFYNTTSLGITDRCTSCDTISFGITGKILDPTSYDYGQSECPWICDERYYKSGENCELCPDGSDTNNETGKTSVFDCQCNIDKQGNPWHPARYILAYTDPDEHTITYGCLTCPGHSTYNGTTHTCGCNTKNANATFDDNNILTSCECPTTQNATANNENVTFDDTNNACLCGYNHYLKNNNGTWTCAQCPSHSHHNITGSEDVNNCVCDATYPTRIYDENDKLIGCGQCPDSNSTYDNATNKCKCIKGYYDTTPEANTVSCAPCPAGSTTLDTENTPNGIGAESKSACKMNSSTLFCDSRGQNCMNLIPNGVEISASAN